MPVPVLSPTPKPFQEALDAHRARVPMSPEQFAALSDEAKLRAFTVSGLAREASILEVYNLAEEALQNGMTMEQFRDRLTAYLEANEGTALSPSRIDLIFRQAIGTARSAGRYQRMMDPDVLAARPYWMYPLGPDDDRTTAICKQLQGFIAPAKSEVWKHIYPPNHFNERHGQVVSLSEKQAKATGRIYEGSEKDAYPWVGDRRAMPDPGFDSSPSLMDSDGAELLARVQQMTEDASLGKTPADYDLPSLSDVPGSAIPDAPALGEALPAAPSPGDVEAAWQGFRDAVAMPEGLDSTLLADLDGDGVIVNRQSFDHIVGADSADPSRRIAGTTRAQFFNFIEPTLSDPTEVWFTPQRMAGGQLAFTKTYIALYQDPESGETYQVFLVRSPQGWLMWSGYPDNPSDADSLRRGYLSYASYRRSDA